MDGPLDWVIYKYKWWGTTYQVSLRPGCGDALIRDLERINEIEFVILQREPKLYFKKEREK